MSGKSCVFMVGLRELESLTSCVSIATAHRTDGNQEAWC